MSDNIRLLNEDLIKHALKDLVRSSVEETLNALLDKEADELKYAQKYERSADRQGYNSGHYKRNFQTTAGEVELKVPKLKGVPFETAIIERYRRRESSVEERCILPRVPCAVWRTSQKLNGESRCLPLHRGSPGIRHCWHQRPQEWRHSESPRPSCALGKRRLDLGAAKEELELISKFA